MKTEKEILDKIKEIEKEYQNVSSYDVEFVYLLKQIEILKWVLGEDNNNKNREIKFRIYDGNNMLYQDKYNFLGSNLLSLDFVKSKVIIKNINDNRDIYFDDKNIFIMQYTGLNDKNGTEIYEGDIVKWKNRENDIFKFAKVFFEDGAFRLYNTYFELNKYENLEVVGNIYENPEICCK